MLYQKIVTIKVTNYLSWVETFVLKVKRLYRKLNRNLHTPYQCTIKGLSFNLGYKFYPDSHRSGQEQLQSVQIIFYKLKLEYWVAWDSNIESDVQVETTQVFLFATSLRWVSILNRLLLLFVLLIRQIFCIQAIHWHYFLTFEVRFLMDWEEG